MKENKIEIISRTYAWRCEICAIREKSKEKKLVQDFKEKHFCILKNELPPGDASKLMALLEEETLNPCRTDRQLLSVIIEYKLLCFSLIRWAKKFRPSLTKKIESLMTLK